MKGPSYSLPRFDDWQAKPEWRLQLDADAYVENFAVGREVFLSGRVSWRTIPGRPDSEGWQYAGDHLYRVTVAGGILDASDLDPTDKMRAKVRDSVATHLVNPSDKLRLRVVRVIIEQRRISAQNTFNQELKDLVTHADQFAKALGVAPSVVLSESTDDD